jgi:hypothetical protein
MPSPSEPSKRPFVSEEERPEVKLDPDKPITELRVRDLTAILSGLTLKKFDHKELLKEFKNEKHELKFELKDKNEKFEKFEKIEHDPVKYVFDTVVDPTRIGPDPALNQIIQTVAGLAAQVGKLANEVAELEKRIER